MIFAEPVAPVGPSPAVLELQSDIVGLVRERSAYRKRVIAIQTALFAAQAEFQATQAALAQYEQEINERMNLIGQLENRSSSIQMRPPETDYAGTIPFPMGNLSGISSEPSRPSDPDDMVNRAHITRNEAIAVRASL